MATHSPNDMGWAGEVHPRLVHQQTSRWRTLYCLTPCVCRPSTPRQRPAVPPRCRPASTQGHGLYSNDTSPCDRSARGLERGCIRPWKKAAACRLLNRLRAPRRRCRRQKHFGVRSRPYAEIKKYSIKSGASKVMMPGLRPADALPVEPRETLAPKARGLAGYADSACTRQSV